MQLTENIQPLGRTLLAFGLALSGTLAAFGATTQTADAATSSARNHYQVSLQAPLDAPRTAIIRGVLWKCEGSSCTGGSDGSRAAGVCARVAKKLGPIARFASPEGEFSAEELARCNAAA